MSYLFTGRGDFNMYKKIKYFRVPENQSIISKSKIYMCYIILLSVFMTLNWRKKNAIGYKVL